MAVNTTLRFHAVCEAKIRKISTFMGIMDCFLGHKMIEYKKYYLKSGNLKSEESKKRARDHLYENKKTSG